MCTGSISHIGYDNDRRLEYVRTYYIYGQSGPSLLIESTDSMIIIVN